MWPGDSWDVFTRDKKDLKNALTHCTVPKPEKKLW